MTIGNINELSDLDNYIINVINQLKKWKKREKKNNIESYSSNENAQTLDLTDILRSCTPHIPIPNASIDPNEVEINATQKDSPNISTIDTPTCSNLP